MIFQAIILQVIFFIGLVLVLRKVLISSSFAETSRLQQLNEENARKAQELAAKISDVENEHREKMLKTDEEIQMMKMKAKKEIEDLKEAIIMKGKAEGDRIITQALNAKEEIRAEIEEQMQDRSIALSYKIFQKVLSSTEQKLVHEGLLEGFFQELDKMDKERLQGVRGQTSEGQSLEVEIKTSYPMSQEQKEKLESILSSKLDGKIVIQETVDKQIIAGILIAMGSLVIDGSLSERFRKAAESFK